ncbi:hypothetical protein LINGRAHAP2_LOCUS29944 [Linum grandiflorum]
MHIGDPSGEFLEIPTSTKKSDFVVSLSSFRGMQRSFVGGEELNALSSKKSFSKGIGITAPKARTRDKYTMVFLEL